MNLKEKNYPSFLSIFCSPTKTSTYASPQFHTKLHKIEQSAILWLMALILFFIHQVFLLLQIIIWKEPTFPNNYTSTESSMILSARSLNLMNVSNSNKNYIFDL